MVIISLLKFKYNNFDNLFVNLVLTLIFTTTINSELGDVDNQTITYNINQNNFISNVNVSLSNYICDSLSSLTIWSVKILVRSICQLPFFNQTQVILIFPSLNVGGYY